MEAWVAICEGDTLCLHSGDEAVSAFVYDVCLQAPVFFVGLGLSAMDVERSDARPWSRTPCVTVRRGGQLGQ